MTMWDHLIQKKHHKYPPDPVFIHDVALIIRTHYHRKGHRTSMSMTAVLSWTLPTTRVDGSPLALTDIASVTVVDGLDGSSTVLPGQPTTFTSKDISGEPGDHPFSVTVQDTSGQSSATASVVVTVPQPVSAAPSPVTGLTGSLVTA